MRGEFRQFQHETSIELSRLDEFEDRMDFLEVEDEDENAKASELTLSELMTGVEYERPILQGKVRKPKSEMGGKGKESDVSSKMQADQELIDLLQQQVTSLTTALEELPLLLSRLALWLLYCHEWRLWNRPLLPLL